MEKMHRGYETKVSVITRTKDRPLLLARVLNSLTKQYFSNFEWIVVNDGGDSLKVSEVIAKAKALHISVKQIDNEVSKGMEAASNQGVNMSTGKYITLLDDDDTWEPDFLSQTIAFLEENQSIRGVVAQSNIVYEEIDGDKFKIYSKSILNPTLNSLHVADLLVENQFQTNAFLYHKEMFGLIGGYDESMPVLGDWDFNLKFILLENIGVIAKPLANYHIRKSANHRELENSVSAGRLVHLQQDAEYRNRKIREDLEKGVIGLGHLLIQGKQFQHSRKELDRLKLVSDVFHAMFRVAKKIGINAIYRKFFKKAS